MAKKRASAKGARPEQGGLAQRVLLSAQRQGMLRAGERVGVAVSGGADSLALLLLLEELRQKLGIVLSVVHFNHKLRGSASDADEKFVAKLAVEHRLAFHLDRGNVAAQARKERANVEDTARRLRYGFFARLVKEGQVDRVAVAHTADDQAETVLAHILRGTGLAGLGGIHPISKHFGGSELASVIRPLLEARRAELRTYLRARRQKWREDVTNRDEMRLRARIRRRLLPLLEKHFQPATVAHLVKLADLAREDEAFLDALATESESSLVKKEKGGARIRTEDLLRPWKRNVFVAEGAGTEQDEEEKTASLSKRIVRRIVEGVKLRPGQLGAQHVEAVLALARHGHSGQAMSLPGGVEVRREYAALLFQAATPPARGAQAGAAQEGRASSAAAFEYTVELTAAGAAVSVHQTGCVFRLRVIDWPAQARETSVDHFAVTRTKDREALDRDLLREPLVLRNWRLGDVFHPAGHHKPRKLKRWLAEMRVSRWDRAGWPVLTSGGVLAWTRGMPAAAEFAVREGTRVGIVMSEEKL